MKKNFLLPVIIFFMLFSMQRVNAMDMYEGDVLTPDSRIINIMPTGNSLTQEAAPGYRGYLYHLLDSAKYQFDFVGSKHDGKPTNGGDPDHSGFGGYVIGPNPSSGDDWDPWKHGDLLWHLDNGFKIMGNNADVIVLEIGINDFFNDRDNYDPNKTGADRLDSLIGKMYKLSPEVVLLVSNLTPVNWDANFGSLFNSEVPAIISKYKKLGKNIYPVDLRKGINWKMSTDISSDQLHPTATGYKKMANLFYSRLVPVLDSMMTVGQTGNAPTIELNQPTTNDSFTEMASIQLTASASDSDGQIRKVVFYSGVQKLGEVTAGPYTMLWSNVLAGNYSITAVAVDNNMNSTTSAPVNIQVKGGGKIVYQENFDDNLAQNWISVNGAWKTLDGKYIDPSGNGVDISIYNANTFFDYIFTATAKPDWNNNYGVVFNFLDNANYYYLELDAEPLDATLKMVKNGTETILKSATYKNGGAGIFSTIELANTGAVTSVKVNNELVFDKIATTQFSSGKIGLYAWWNPLTFDNVQVVASAITSINSVEGENPDLKIYPNPVNDQLLFSSNNLLKGNYKAEIYNSTGSLVKSKDCNSSGSIPVGDLRNGMYILKVYQSSTSFLGKFIIERL